MIMKSIRNAKVLIISTVVDYGLYELAIPLSIICGKTHST